MSVKLGRRNRSWMARGLLTAGILALAGVFGSIVGGFSTQEAADASAVAPAQAAFRSPTYSSPISMSANGRLVLVVSPDTDSLSVIRTDNNTVLRELRVGNEPRSVAIDPRNRYIFVANAAAGTVSVIRVRNPTFRRWSARLERTLVTGAEPWNIVISPNGRRVFVANSAQDTITVINARTRRIIGHVDLRRSLCNDPDRSRHFQPRGLAVTRNNRYLYVTSFFSFVRPGGRQGEDTGREGVVCRLNINTSSTRISGYRPAARITLAPRETGFTVDRTGDATPEPTSAFPNQLQSIVIRGNQAYLPNIAASPEGPLRFNVSTQAFVNVIDGVNSGSQSDASGAKFLNLHLGARQPEDGKKRLFFANVWAIGFTNQSGSGNAYVVSAGSDLLVKVNVAGDGRLSFTVDDDTTRYIDLNDPANPATSGENAGKNPQGIAINPAGTRAYVYNFVSRNVSVVNLREDRVIRVIRTRALPAPGSTEEVLQVGAEVFFSSRGHFNRPPGTTVSTDERLSSEGWQSCASCHFEGLTDSVVWAFASGPRKSVPLNSTFNPRNRGEQRVLNYSAVMDEVEDFSANIRNISGPGGLPTPIPCSPPGGPTGNLDPDHGLIFGDDGNINMAPCTLNQFALPNANRPQHTVTLPGSTVAVPALTAMKEWVRLAIRTPRGPFVGARFRGPSAADVQAGRTLFQQAGCTNCHVGGLWTTSRKDFTSPPAATEIATERTGTFTGNPAGLQFLHRFLRDIGSFNLGVAGAGNPIGNNIGAVEKATQALVGGVAGAAPDALGIDYNGDGRGVGYSPPSLLGIHASPPYYHNGACESIACVVGNFKHRTANGRQPDRLGDAEQQAQVVAFVESISAATAPFEQAGARR